VSDAGPGQLYFPPSLGFQGDIPTPTIPVSAWSPSGESASDPSTRASAEASKTQSLKCKAAVNLTPQKKAKKVTGKSTSGIKINEPAPKASPALTPPSGPRKKISIHRSNRYA
jgi:hypothetical protein